jgi:hypothetical protein
MNIHRRKWTNESQGKPEQKFDAAYGIFLVVFKEASINLLLILLLDKTG